MTHTTDRLDRLEGQICRLRWAVLVLTVVLLATFILGAASGTPDELTLRTLVIVDADGKERIRAATSADGTAFTNYLDGDGMLRISARTQPDGTALIAHYDRDGKARIRALTHPNGLALTTHADRNTQTRIAAMTLPDGTAMFGLNDHKGEPVWGEASEARTKSSSDGGL